MAGSDNNLSTHKMHPPKCIFPGQSCDKGFKYRKRQRELNSKGALGGSYVNNGPSVRYKSDGVDGTHPYGGIAHVSVGRDGDGAGAVPGTVSHG